MNELRADLLRVARRVLRDPVQAEDVVQDAFLRFHTAEQPIVRPDAWLRRVTRNLALDRVRARSLDALEEVPVEPPERDDGTEAVAAWLPAFVDALEEPYRTAVREVDLEGIPQSEFARRHGLSASGARTRVQRGRRQVHENLLACCAVAFEDGSVVDTGIRTGCAPGPCGSGNG